MGRVFPAARLTPRRSPLIHGHWAFSPDGKTLATAFRGVNAVALWDVTKEKPRRRATLGAGWPLSLVFSPDGKKLGANGGLHYGSFVWDVSAETPALLFEFARHAYFFESFGFSSDGKILASTGRSTKGSVLLWDISGAKAKELPPLTKEVRGGADEVSIVNAWPKGKVFAIGWEAGGMAMWDLESAKRERRGPVDIGFRTFYPSLARG